MLRQALHQRSLMEKLPFGMMGVQFLPLVLNSCLSSLIVAQKKMYRKVLLSLRILLCLEASRMETRIATSIGIRIRFGLGCELRLG